MRLYTGTTVMTNINLFDPQARTCWSPVTTLCRFQYDVAGVCTLPSVLLLFRCRVVTKRFSGFAATNGFSATAEILFTISPHRPTGEFFVSRIYLAFTMTSTMERTPMKIQHDI